MVREISTLICGTLCCLALVFLMVGSSEAFAPESLLGVWLFDEGNGNDVMDSSGMEHNGTLTGNDVERVDGKFGDALEFVGGGKVDIPHADEFSTPTFTLMAWIDVEEANTNWQLIVGKDGWPDRNYVMFVAKDTGVIHFAFCAPGQQDAGNFNATSVVANGEWRHVAITYDLQMRRVYVDGVLDAENPSTIEPSTSTVNLEIGRGFTGIIDEVLIANEAFSGDDIKLAMEIGLADFTAGVGAVSAADKLATTWGAIRSETR